MTDIEPTAGKLDLTENAIKVLQKRYLKRDESGEPTEEPIDMFRRVADNIASAEETFAEAADSPRNPSIDGGDPAPSDAQSYWRERFLELMTSRKFMPNSPTLMNAGRDLQQLSACYVLPVEDSMEEIYDTLKNQALVHKSGGGTGFSFSRLRPKNDLVRSTMGVSSGPISFMSVFDSSTEHVKQGGTRRGANMGILRVDHPDIEEFVDCKRETDQVNNFNISVAVTDDFMRAVREGTDFALRNPRDGGVEDRIDARELFDKIAEGAWRNGEPGVVFIDLINDDNPTPQFPIESTNPCSEAHLPPYDSCNLGSINLERFVEHGSERALDWPALEEAVATAVRFLDNVVEVNNYPLNQIAEMSRGNRRIGLGVMGFADALIELGIAYDSDDALAFAEEVMSFIDAKAWEASRALASERGVYENWADSRHGQEGDEVRNATVTTIAPTGTISMIAGCSGGIEPLFAVAFMRRQADMEMPDVNPAFVETAKTKGFYSEELMQRLAHHGAIRDAGTFPEIPDEVRTAWATSHDVGTSHHVEMQAAFQRHTSMGISKTINLPNDAQVSDVENAYLHAYSTGCKAIAVYRDGSREEQVLSTGKSGQDGAPATANGKVDTTNLPADEPAGADSTPNGRNGRPRTLSGATKKIRTGHGPLFVSMNDDNYGPRECFVVLGKPGGTASAFSDALGRMISLALTRGASPEEVHHQLRGIQDGHPAGVGPGAVLSVPDGVARAMEEHYLTKASDQPAADPGPPVDQARPAFASEPEHDPIANCPQCGTGMVRRSNCNECIACGYTTCS